MLKVVLIGGREILRECLDELMMYPNTQVSSIYTSPSFKDSIINYVTSRQWNIPVKWCDIKKDYAYLQGLKPDLLISVQYRYRVSKEIINLLKGYCFNLHFSLLPRYAGCYPVTWALRNGEAETGVTMHAMTENFDDGEIISQEKVMIDTNETCERLFGRQMTKALALFKKILPKLLNRDFQSRKQGVNGFQYYNQHSIDWKRDIFIDWSKSIEEIHNHIRAFTFPEYQLPTTFINGIQVTVSGSEVEACTAGNAHVLHATGSYPAVAIRGGKAVIIKDGKSLSIEKINGLCVESFLRKHQIKPTEAFFHTTGFEL